jgi:hypothetical protein
MVNSRLLAFFAISAQLRSFLLAFLPATCLSEPVPAGTDLLTCGPNAGKTVRARGEPPAAISSFNNSVIICNLALTHHLRTMEEQSEQSTQSRPRKALASCEHAHRILVSQEIDVSLLHSMPIACNLGHIHHMTGNEEPPSQMCFIAESHRNQCFGIPCISPAAQCLIVKSNTVKSHHVSSSAILHSPII